MMSYILSVVVHQDVNRGYTSLLHKVTFLLSYREYTFSFVVCPVPRNRHSSVTASPTGIRKRDF